MNSEALTEMLAAGQGMGMDELRNNLADVVEQVATEGEPAIVKRYGKAVAAIVPLAELRALLAEVEAGKHLALAAQAESNFTDYGNAEKMVAALKERTLARRQQRERSQAA